MNYIQYDCSICKSENVYSFEEIYHSIKANNISALFTAKRIRFKGERDKTKFTNLILARTIPPPKPTLAPFDLSISIGGGFIGMIVGVTGNELLRAFIGNYFQVLIFILTLIGGCLVFRSRYKRSIQEKRVEWAIKFQKWQDSWICLKCGNSWQE